MSHIGLAGAFRAQAPLDLALLDLDHFKAVNATYGRSAGDDARLAVAEWLRRLTRARDVVCRYGGAAFVVVLPGVSLAVTWQRAEAWLARFRDTRVEHDGLPPRITFSSGAAVCPSHGPTGEQLQRTADRALTAPRQRGATRSSRRKHCRL